jgi:hypothetical protein
MLRQAGLDLIADEVAQAQEPQGPVDFLWVPARKRRL